MGKMRSAFVELEPADNAVVREIFCYASFGNAEMFGELRLERIGASAACTAAQKISDSDAERLAGFDVIVAGEVGIGEDENAGTDGRVIRFADFYGRAGQQSAKLHFEKRQSRRKAGITGTAAHTRPRRIANRFDGERRYGAARSGPCRPGFGRLVENS